MSHFQRAVRSEFARRVDAGIEYVKVQKAAQAAQAAQKAQEAQASKQPPVETENEETPKKHPVKAVEDFVAHLTTGWDFTPARPVLNERSNPAVWSWYQNYRFKNNKCQYK